MEEYRPVPVDGDFFKGVFWGLVMMFAIGMYIALIVKCMLWLIRL